MRVELLGLVDIRDHFYPNHKMAERCRGRRGYTALVEGWTLKNGHVTQISGNDVAGMLTGVRELLATLL